MSIGAARNRRTIEESFCVVAVTCGVNQTTPAPRQVQCGGGGECPRIAPGNAPAYRGSPAALHIRSSSPTPGCTRRTCTRHGSIRDGADAAVDEGVRGVDEVGGQGAQIG